MCKAFPNRTQLIKFVRQVTGKTQRAAERVLEQVRIGVEAAISRTRQYAKGHKDARPFVERFTAVAHRGLQRLES